MACKRLKYVFVAFEVGKEVGCTACDLSGLLCFRRDGEEKEEDPPPASDLPRRSIRTGWKTKSGQTKEEKGCKKRSNIHNQKHQKRREKRKKGREREKKLIWDLQNPLD